jgi:O-antigen/teichoic acid export membrane protein
VTVPAETPDAPLRADSIARNTLFGLATQLTSAAFTAALTLYLVRALGPSRYGVFALALGIGVIVVLASDLGITHSTERFIAERRGDRAAGGAYLADAFKLKLAAAAALCGLLFAAAGPIADAYDDQALAWPLRAMALAVLGQSMLLLFRGAFIALGRVSLTWRVTTLESAVEAGASVVLVVAGAGAAGAAWGRSAGYLLGVAVAIFLALRVFGGRRGLTGVATEGRRRQIAAYAAALFVINAAFTLFEQIDVLLIGAIVSTSAVGLFEAPMRIGTFLGYGGQAVAFGVAPRLASGSGERVDVRVFETALRALVLVQAALVAPVLVWASPIVDLALGGEYGQSAGVLRTLAPFVFLSAIATFVTLSVNYLGEARRRIPLVIGAVLVNLIVDLILIPDIGVIGGAVGTDVAFALYVLAHLWLCAGLVGFRALPLLVTTARALAAAGAMSAVLAAFGTSDLSAATLVGGAVLAAAAYSGVLVLTRELTARELLSARRSLTAALSGRSR